MKRSKYISSDENGRRENKYILSILSEGNEDICQFDSD